MGGLANTPTFRGVPGFAPYVEAEAQGQRELVGSGDLPVDTHGTDRAFLDLGFTFGEPHPHDALFHPATLPQGWRHVGSDHAMWSHLMDEQGRQRVAVFYKAAYYDRRAHMYLIRAQLITQEVDACGVVPVVA